jgi:uncharacterized membrane protein
MVAVFAASLVGAAVLWPSGDELPAARQLLASGTHFEYGTVTAIGPDANPGSQAGATSPIPEPSLATNSPAASLTAPTADPVSSSLVARPLASTMADVQVRLDGREGAVPIQPVPEVSAADLRVGDRVKVLFVPEVLAAGNGSPYVFVDFERGQPLALLAGLFALAVIAVARWKGLAALVGLVVGFAIVWFFALPALAAGRNAAAVALVCTGLILFVVVYATHGISVRTTAALLGTYLGAAIVLGLASWAIPATHLTPRTHQDMGELMIYAPQVDLAGVLLCGMMLAGIGVLNDVTITQASAVWELQAADPRLPRRSLFTRAMRIGRDHIASTVYTIAFAYVGTALATLLLVRTFDHSFAALVTFEEVADEIVRTLVASVGLVVAIPLTTALAAVLATGSTVAEPMVETGSAATQADRQPPWTKRLRPFRRPDPPDDGSAGPAGP